MDTYISITILIIILLSFSAFFSANETALTAINRIRIKNQAELGDKKALLILNLIKNYDNTLTALLILNNVVNILSTSIITVTFAKIFKNNSIGIATGLMTVLIILFGEVIPKNLAKLNPEILLKKSVHLLLFFVFITKPFSFFLNLFKKMFSKNIIAETQIVTEEELICIIDEIEEEGILEENQAELVQNAIEFNDISAVEIITPRVDITAVEINENIDSLKELFLCFNYSRIPVYEGSIDNICGFINQKDLFSKLLKSENFKWQDLIKPCLYFPPKKKIIEIMEDLQREKVHMAVITDEYGGTFGILTLEDILEEIVGEIWDEHDEILDDINMISEDTYVVIGDIDLISIYEKIFPDKRFIGENMTISAYLFEQLNAIPNVGDIFQDETFYYEILEMNENRIIKIKVKIN